MDSTVEIPIVYKRTAQVISITDTVQLMDSETYEVFEVPLPDDENLRKKLEPGIQVEYWTILEKKKIVRIKS